MNIFFGANQFTSNDHKSLNDSIRKYSETNSNKALDFGFEVLEAVDLDNPTRDLVGTYSLIGQVLTYKLLYAEALSYFSEALKVYELVPKSELIEQKPKSPPWLLINIGNLYYATGDIENAKLKVLEAKENFLLYKNERNREIGLNTVYGNLGLFASIQGDYKLAEELYLKVLSSRRKLKDLDGEMYSYAQLVNLFLNNKSQLYKSNEYFDKAKIFYNNVNKDYGIDETSIFQRNYGYLAFQYGEYYRLKNEFDSALNYLNKAKELLANFPDEIPSVNSQISQCYIGLKDLNNAEKSAIENLKSNSISQVFKKVNFEVLESVYRQRKDLEKLISIKDSLIDIGGISVTSNVKALFSNLETQILLTEKQSELNQNKIRYNTYLFILIIGVVILFFSLITIRVNFNYQKERNIRLEVEKDVTKTKLEKKQLELVSKTNFIAQRNNYLDILKQSVLKQKGKNKDSEKVSFEIEREIDRIIGSKKIFENFESQFTEVYPEFFKVLVSKYGKLSQTDLRLCAYIKMNQSTNEISQITGVSIRTVETQRYRLGKKIKLSSSESLNTVIISI